VALRIEEYALIGDTQAAALVGTDGSIDWLCLPRFDSGACFAALLGTSRHGRWLLAPRGGARKVERRYERDTLVLVTEFTTDTGVVEVVDCMPPRQLAPDVVRIVRGIRGYVEMEMELVIRFDYGSIVPWVQKRGGVLRAVAGPDALYLHTPVSTKGQDLTTIASFSVSAGQQVPFVLTWHPSERPAPTPVDAVSAVTDTMGWWREWTRTCAYEGPLRDDVVRSLITLKALTYAPTGGIVAAPTMSLPERLGGIRNWDYRYCWVRDATFTLDALMAAGYRSEATAWVDWLLRAVAGEASRLQILYGPAGERRISERELPWLPGYQGSVPVHLGNAAAEQFQLDVYGEILDAMYRARSHGIAPAPHSWAIERALVQYLAWGWREPDNGIWEVRGPRRHFTHSKVMAWVAVDRAVKSAETFGLPAPVDRWRALREEIRGEVLEKGYDARRNTFTQYFGGTGVDASLLVIPRLGFLPPDDPRVAGTVAAVERELMTDGLVRRYVEEGSSPVDGLPPGEGAFLACSFWLADNYVMLGRMGEARRLLRRLLDLRNDVGLLSEEYDTHTRRLVGNFPQAFSHVGLINTARALSGGMVP
jgi:GH15 family glucan-1,4-alpha-glucosidase